MQNYLLFQLWGPLASWGDIAIGEVRSSHSAPTKSAILGLVAACLGIPRTDEADLLALNSALSFGVRVDAPGTVMQDYHTTQTPGNKKYRDLGTRRDEVLAAAENNSLEAILSRREYRCDASYTIGLWSEDVDLLTRVEAALRHPKYTPFLGRKSCPIALPMKPMIIQCTSLREAFGRYEHQRGFTPDETRFIWEGNDNQGFDAPIRVERHERLISRARWQFGALTLNEAYESGRS